MKQFIVGETYHITDNVIFKDNTNYLCVKHNLKTVVFYDDFYKENIKLKIKYENGREYVTIPGGRTFPLEIWA